jgi:hypothetical protein
VRSIFFYVRRGDSQSSAPAKNKPFVWKGVSFPGITQQQQGTFDETNNSFDCMEDFPFISQRETRYGVLMTNTICQKQTNLSKTSKKIILFETFFDQENAV